MPDPSIPAARRVRPLSRAITRARVQGVPMYAIAEEAGITKGYLSDIASGKERPSLDVAARIAAALGDDVADLFPGLK
jgi:transcriptional regulator with XRE-family HTH domain